MAYPSIQDYSVCHGSSSVTDNMTVLMVLMKMTVTTPVRKVGHREEPLNL